MPTTETGMAHLYAAVALPPDGDPLLTMKAVTDLDTFGLGDPLDETDWTVAVRHVDSTESRSGRQLMRTVLFWLDEDGEECIGGLDVTPPDQYPRALAHLLAELAALLRETRAVTKQARAVMTAIAIESDMREFVVHDSAPDNGD